MVKNVNIDDLHKVVGNNTTAARMTVIKTDFLLKQGMEITGFILTNPTTGDTVTIHNSKVTWNK